MYTFGMYSCIHLKGMCIYIVGYRTYSGIKTFMYCTLNSLNWILRAEYMRHQVSTLNWIHFCIVADINNDCFNCFLCVIQTLQMYEEFQSKIIFSYRRLNKTCLMYYYIELFDLMPFCLLDLCTTKYSYFLVNPCTHRRCSYKLLSNKNISTLGFICHRCMKVVRIIILKPDPKECEISKKCQS